MKLMQELVTVQQIGMGPADTAERYNKTPMKIRDSLDCLRDVFYDKNGCVEITVKMGEVK